MRRWPGSAAVAALLVVTLVGGPVARAVTMPGCHACPPHCPMHRKAKLSCHESAGQRAGRHHGCGARGPGIAPPGCAAGSDMSAIALPPAVLPPPVVVGIVIDAQTYPTCNAAPCVRGADPPDTPPPIAAS